MKYLEIIHDAPQTRRERWVEFCDEARVCGFRPVRMLLSRTWKRVSHRITVAGLRTLAPDPSEDVGDGLFWFALSVLTLLTGILCWQCQVPDRPQDFWSRGVYVIGHRSVFLEDLVIVRARAFVAGSLCGLAFITLLIIESRRGCRRWYGRRMAANTPEQFEGGEGI